MDMNDERDYEEEEYNGNLCPGCDHSPCFDPEACKADNEEQRYPEWTEAPYPYDVHELSEMEYHAG